MSAALNLQYPLLWNDEAECAMHSKHVLEYGYPKVHGEKNVVYPIRHPNKSLAINESTDAYTGIGWVMFYYGALATKIASGFEDIYTQTLFLRLPFLLIGFIGVWMIFKNLSHFFLNKREYKIARTLFFILLTLQIDFALHLREMRYYSIIIFLLGLCIHWLIKYRILDKRRLGFYLVAQTITLWLMYNTFAPIYLALNIFLVAFELVIWLREKKIMENLMFSLPAFISGLLLLPIIFFFDSINFSQQTSELHNFSGWVYLSHLKTTILYFVNLSYGWWVLGLGSLILILYLRKKIILRKTEFTLLGLVAFGLIYFFLINMVPHKIFTRYLIPLLIIEIGILVFQIIVIYKHLTTGWFYCLILALLGTFIYQNQDNLKGRAYELTHEYRGRLDYEIPFLKKQFEGIENPVLATNYEECSYMYYLDCKVVMGFVLNNREEDEKTQPDAIIFRKEWAWNYEKSTFDPFFKRGVKYDEYRLKVLDYPYNNIPDLSLPGHNHLFQTAFAATEEEKVVILVKKP